RIRFFHVLLGPLLWREDGWLPFPNKNKGDIVPDYYKRSYKGEVDPSDELIRNVSIKESPASGVGIDNSSTGGAHNSQGEPSTEKAEGINPEKEAEEPARKAEAEVLQSVDRLPFLHPKRLLIT